MNKSNAERAERAEAALLAYIDYTGDSFTANGLDTWIGDLLCDLRHLARFKRVEFNPDAGELNYRAEVREDPDGTPVFTAQWYIEGRKLPKHRARKP